MAAINVSTIKEIVLEWVLNEAASAKDFCGAFYHGSINWLSENATFPPASDVDLMIVLATATARAAVSATTAVPAPQLPQGKFLYRNILLDISYISVDDLQSAEQVLNKYYLAGDFARPAIIADPSGHLTRLQREVASKYATTFWVNRRCEGARDNALRYIALLSESDPLHNQVTNWLFARGVLTHILLVAGLKNPTVRRRYVDVQRLLEENQLLDFYESLLELSGFHNLSPTAVQSHLTALTEVYDMAATILKTPYQFASDISTTARPISIDGTRQLIDTGFHREAMFWIIATHCRCQQILHQDAPPEIKEKFAAVFLQLLDQLNIASYKDRIHSNTQTLGFIPQVWQTAQTILTRNPLITGGDQLKY